jgi:hypothetical protein
MDNDINQVEKQNNADGEKYLGNKREADLELEMNTNSKKIFYNKFIKIEEESKAVDENIENNNDGIIPEEGERSLILISKYKINNQLNQQMPN